jgi:predicted dehydrogenase
MSNKRVRVAIVGLGFGSEFIPIYQAHPDAEMYAICRRNRAELDACGDKFGIPKERRFVDFDVMLRDPNIDAVHINSPIPDHGPQTIAALKAGKHVACTVPMATSKEQIKEIVELQRKVGKVYMMMETVVYAREYLFAKDLYDRGVLGRIQFLRGSHQQDMDGWPGYWPGLPPMWYATHCVSPCLAIMSTPKKSALAESVVCHGSGRIREEYISIYDSEFAIETATFKIKDTNVCAEVTRSLYDTARQYRESFDVTASNVSFEWQQLEGEDPVLHMRGLPEHQIPRRVKVPDFAGRLPEPIRKFTGAIHDATHLSFVQGGGHGGSHPHLAHNFLMAVLGAQPAFPDAPTSANWTLVGICAHESAKAGGDRVMIPMY